MRFAQIEDVIIVNIVVAETDFEKSGYVSIDGLNPEPTFGWTHNGEQFINPIKSEKEKLEPSEPADIPDAIKLSRVSNSMIVKFQNGNLFIGCLEFPPEWSKETLGKLLYEDAPSVGEVVATKSGITYNNNFVSWLDCERIYNYLEAAKF